MHDSKEIQVRNSFLYILNTIVTIALPLAALSIFTRILSRQDYGVLALAQMCALLISGLANFGLQSTYRRNYFKYRDDLAKSGQLLLSTLIFVILLFLFLLSLVSVFIKPLVSLFIGRGGNANILFCALWATFIYGICEYYFTYFVNSGKAKLFITYNIIRTFINILAGLILVAYFKVGVIGLLYAQLCAGSIIFVVLSCKFCRLLPLRFNKDILGESLKIGCLLTPRMFLGVINTQFDKFMIRLLASIGGVGIYSIAQKVSNSVFIFTTSLQKVFQPQVYTKMFTQKEEGGREIGKYLTPFFYLSIFVALLVSLFSEEVISLLTPKSYHGAIDIIIILSMYYGLLFFGKQPQLIFKKKTGLVSILATISVGINIALNIPFIMLWGVIGAAWATLLARLISGLISFVVAQRHYEIKWEYKKIGIILGLFFLASFLMIVLRHSLRFYPARLAVKSLFLLAYVYFGMKINVITRDNLKLIKEIFSFRKPATVSL